MLLSQLIEPPKLIRSDVTSPPSLGYVFAALHAARGEDWHDPFAITLLR